MANHMMHFSCKKLAAALGGAVSLLAATPGQAAERIGVLVSSFGDVDAKEEVEAFVKKTLMDPDVAPIPNLARPIVTYLGWELKKSSIYKEYETIGWATGFRETSQRQADAIAEELRRAGHDAKGYAGFTMTTPWVEDALDAMQRDGVNRVIIFYQGAQYSKPTAYIVERNAKRHLLQKMPDWDARVTMVKSFSDDPRFRKLLIDGINERLNTTFGSYRRNEVCLVLPMHGNPMPLVRAGDPAYPQMMRTVDAMKNAFPEVPLHFGFQNHDEISKDWTTPSMKEVVKQVASDSCRAVLINGRITFTVDSLETLYDHAQLERDAILAAAPQKPVFVEKMFNTEPGFVKFMKELAEEALEDRGDLVELR